MTNPIERVLREKKTLYQLQTSIIIDVNAYCAHLLLVNIHRNIFAHFYRCCLSWMFFFSHKKQMRYF
jgi:hypothetical protein